MTGYRDYGKHGLRDQRHYDLSSNFFKYVFFEGYNLYHDVYISIITFANNICAPSLYTYFLLICWKCRNKTKQTNKHIIHPVAHEMSKRLPHKYVRWSRQWGQIVRAPVIQHYINFASTCCRIIHGIDVKNAVIVPFSWVTSCNHTIARSFICAETNYECCHP